MPTSAFDDILEERKAARQAPSQAAAPPQRAQLSDQDALRASAARLGMDPLDYANVISYETLGKFSPSIRGGAGNRHIGLIQFGENEQRQFGAHQGQSFQEQLPAVEKYLRSRGFKPGMNIYDLYSTINAGSPGRYGASDRPGSTVASHVSQMLGGHRQIAAKWLGEAYTQPGGAPATLPARRAAAAPSEAPAFASVPPIAQYEEPPFVGGARADFLGSAAPADQLMQMQDYGKSDFAPDRRQDFGASEFDDILQNGPMLGGNTGATSAPSEFDDILAEDTSTWGGWFKRGLASSGRALTSFMLDKDLISPETATQQYINQARIIADNPLSPEDQRARQDLEAREGVGDVASWYVENPGAALRQVGESVGQSVVPGIASGLGAVAGIPGGPPGIAAGAAAGAMLGSAPVEIGAAMQEALAEQGYDMTSPEGWQQALSNPNALEYARRQAAAKGLSVAAFDTAASLFATAGGGPLLRRGVGALTGRPAAQGPRFGDAATGIGVQAASGGLGEYVGGEASGMPASWQDIAAEVTGEAVTGIPEVVLGSENIDRMQPTAPPQGEPEFEEGEAQLALPKPRLALPAPAIPLGDDTIRLPDGTPAPQPTGLSPQPATPEDYPPTLRLAPPTPATPPDLPPVVRESQRPTFDEAVAADRNFFGVARPGADAAVVDTDYERAEGRATSGDAQVIAAPGSAITAGVTEVVGATGWISRAKSINPNIPVEELVASISDVASYKRAYKQGLRVTPKNTAIVFEPKRWQVQAKMETPLMKEAVQFLGSDGALRKPTGDVDLRKIVSDPRIFAAPTQRFLQRIAKDLKANIYAPRLFEVSGNAKRTVESSGWNALFSELNHQSALHEWVVSPAVERFKSGEIKLRPSFQHNPSRASGVLLTQYSVFGRDKNTDMAKVVSDVMLRKPVEVQGPAGSHFGVDQYPVHTSWVKPTIGQVYTRKPSSNKPVTVVEGGTYLSGAHQQAARAAIHVIEHFKEKFKIKVPLMIVINATRAGNLLTQHFEPGSDLTSLTSSSGGHFTTNHMGTDAAIVVTDRWSPAGLYDTLMHEFGHYLSYTAFADASPDVQAQIFAAYRRYLRSKPSGVTRPVNVGSLVQDDPNTTYYDTFEEWFAQQVARWGSASMRPMSLVGKFFRGLFNRIQEVFATRTGYKNAAVEVATWLNSMAKGEATAFYGNVVAQQMEAKTAAQNAKHGVSVPGQDETAKLSLLLDRYGSQSAPQMPGVSIPGTKPSTRRDIKADLDNYNWFYKWYANFRQVADRNLHIQELQIYKGYIEQMQLAANKKMMRADENIQLFRDLRNTTGKKPSVAANQADALFGFAFDMTNMVYRTPQEVAAGVRRQPTTPEKVALANKWGMDAKAAAMWGRLEKDFKVVVAEMTELRLQKIQATIAPGPIFDKAVAQVHADAAKLLAAPYFPLTRFGHYAVSVRNSADKIEEFQTFENPQEQRKAHEALKKQYPEAQGFNVVASTLPKDVTNFQGMPSWMLEQLKQMPGINENQRRWIEQFQYEYSPEMSFSKHLMRRKYTPGYSKEGERVYANYMFHYARNYARLLYADPARDMVQQVLRADRYATGSPNINKRTQIGEYMRDHLESVLNPKADSSALRVIAANWFLGFNPQSAALNLTQIPVMTLPYLSQHFGDIKSMAAIMRGYKDMTRYFKKNAPFGNDLRGQAMKWLRDANLIDENMAAELASLSSGGYMLSQKFGGYEMQRGWLKFTEKAMTMFRATEKVNRWVTALAAYELAMNNPDAKYLNEVVQANPIDADSILNDLKTLPGPSRQKQMRAILAAKQALLDTQYDYSKVARPRFMRGRAGDFFIFYSFTQNTIMQLLNKRHRGMLLRYSLMMLLFAGAMGLVPDDIEEVVSFAMKRLGDKLGYSVGSLETEARKLVAAVLDPEWGDVVMHGAGYYGFAVPQVMQMMGIDWAPLPNFDISGLVAMRSAAPVDISPLFKYSDYNQAVAKTAEGLAGAGFGIALNFTNALLNNELQWGDPKLWESIMPSTMRNVARSMRAYSEGGITNKQGATIVPYHADDPLHIAELVGYAAGLTPTRVSDFYNRQTAHYDAQNYWEMKRGILLNRAFRAKMVNKDNDAFSEVVQDIRDFNKEAPDKKFIISSDTIKRSFRTQEKRKRGVETGRDINIAPAIDAEIDRLYPNVIEKRALSRPQVSAPPVSVP
jgi:hypothetical protein